MITIPTRDLIGVVSDVLPFTIADKDLPEYGIVRLEWDGEKLEALAVNGLAAAVSSWSPDDDTTEYDEDILSLATAWGGDDDSWSVNLQLDDAKGLVATYKLAAKDSWAPLTVEHINLTSVRIVRTKDSGHPAITTVIKGSDATFPDCRKMVARKARKAVSVSAYSPKVMALFAKVRPRGPMVLEFAGDKSSTRVRIGDRFVGAILPTDPNPVRLAPSTAKAAELDGQEALPV